MGRWEIIARALFVAVTWATVLMAALYFLVEIQMRSCP